VSAHKHRQLYRLVPRKCPTGAKSSHTQRYYESSVTSPCNCYKCTLASQGIGERHVHVSIGERSEMRNPSRFHEKVHNVQETLTKDETLQVTSISSRIHHAVSWGTPPARLTDARTMSGVSAQPILDLHHQLSTPPTVRARVKEGTLYMPVMGQSVRSDCEGS
jgi:hypothetical protein